MRRICPFALVHPPNHGPMPQIHKSPPCPMGLPSCPPPAPGEPTHTLHQLLTFCAQRQQDQRQSKDAWNLLLHGGIWGGGEQLPPPSLPASQRAFVKFPGSRESCSTQNCQQALPGRAYKPKLHLSSGKGGREATP